MNLGKVEVIIIDPFLSILRLFINVIIASKKILFLVMVRLTVMEQRGRTDSVDGSIQLLRKDKLNV